MKKIVLPTDFSENAKNAIEYAIAMFSYDNVEYILLNVYSEPHSSTDMLVSVKDLLEKTSRKSLKEEYEYFNNKFSQNLLNMRQHSECGELSDVINNLVETENIDFVVMGTKGATGLQKILVGSNTHDVVNKAKCPVLAIPEKIKYTPPYRIAFATDYEELENKYVLHPLAELANQYRSKLMIVNIYNIGENIINVEQAAEGIQLHYMLKNIPHQFFGISHKNIATGIDQFVHKHKVDLLAMIARQHNFFNRLFHDSTTKQLAMLTDIPLLVLHEK